MDEQPEAGDEWIAKAMMLGRLELFVDISVWGALWKAHLPGHGSYFGITKARACRKLVRSIIGDIE